MSSVGCIPGKGRYSCPGCAPTDVPLDMVPVQALLCHQSPAGAISCRRAPALLKYPMASPKCSLLVRNPSPGVLERKQFLGGMSRAGARLGQGDTAGVAHKWEKQEMIWSEFATSCSNRSPQGDLSSFRSVMWQ